MNRHTIIQELRNQRKTYKEIAEILGISKQRVHQIYKEYKSIKPYIIKEVKKRDNYQCAICDGEAKLEVHHINGIRKDNHRDNLVTLCRKCHIRIEKKDIELKDTEKKYFGNLRPDANSNDLEIKRLVLQYRNEGKSLREIGEMFGRSHNWARSTLQKIRK